MALAVVAAMRPAARGAVVVAAASRALALVVTPGVNHRREGQGGDHGQNENAHLLCLPWKWHWMLAYGARASSARRISKSLGHSLPVANGQS
jgi:hypothetical protein